MKLQDIEALLNLPHKGEIELVDIEMNDIEELARYFGVEIQERTFRQFIIVKRNDMEVTLCSSIVLGDVPFPHLTQ